MKRPWMTIRALMSLVAIAALSCFGVAVLRRSAEFTRRAERHRLEVLEDTLNARAATAWSFEHDRQPTAEEEADRRFFLRHAEAEKRLYAQYRRAARWPWLSVGPEASGPGR